MSLPPDPIFVLSVKTQLVTTRISELCNLRFLTVTGDFLNKCNFQSAKSDVVLPETYELAVGVHLI